MSATVVNPSWIPTQAAWVNGILAVVGPLLPKDFYGQVELNIQGGGITNVNVLQSFKPATAEERRISR